MLEHYKELHLYIKNKISNKDYAQDILQETYAKAIAMQNTQKIENSRALLYKVAKNIIIDMARKNKDLSEVEFNENYIIPSALTPEDLVIEQDNQKILMNELKKLPPKMKEAFVLYALEDYTKEEVAKTMNISIQAVEKHISRAKIELKEKLKRKEEY
ncbi:RNA polymerase sigma factor [Arcobacter sp. CECT 9188]|uniref:RNA polymerase sigma factor n=1 Tax=Arcobacter sp. CECT 9188 TaxID=2044505 RepID=UPI000DEA8B9A|nr:RNA polymerase sigma factor [Arcobacter sp. CECT 9188]RBQ26315.1 RNA polymerase subunit sigma [Arcobacter sp. CECT 9188]